MAGRSVVVPCLLAVVIGPAAADGRRSDGRLGGPLTERRSLVAEGRTVSSTTIVPGRVYTEYATGARTEQLDPLHAAVTITFGEEVRTVGDAAHRLLSGVGFTLLADGPNVSPLLPALLDAPLPRMQREFRKVRVREILRALAGRGFVPVADHLKRRVTMDPRPLYHRTGARPEADDNGLAAGWGEQGPQGWDRARPLVPAVPGTSARERLGDDERDLGEWQVVEAGPSDRGKQAPERATASLRERLSFGERVRRRIGAWEVTERASDAFTLEIASLVPGQRLGASDATALRRLASAFVRGRDVVRIADCPSGEDGARHQRTLVHLALEQQGVGERDIELVPCHAGAAEGATVVSLVENAVLGARR